MRKTLLPIMLLIALIIISSNCYAALTDGIIVYYSFDNSTMSGTTVKDIQTITTQNNATISSAALQGASGKLGQGVTWTAASQYVRSNNNIGLSGNAARTVGGWYYLPSNNWSCAFSMGTATSSDGMYASYSANSFRIGRPYGDINFAGTPPIGQWFFWVVTFNGSTASMYINGTYVGGGSSYTWSTTNTPLFLGLDSYALCDSFINNKMDEVFAYNRALNTTEINTLYNNGAGLNPFNNSVNGSISNVTFLSPTVNASIEQYLNITFTNASTIGAYISSYNISILNYDLSLNKSLFYLSAANSSLSDLSYGDQDNSYQLTETVYITPTYSSGTQWTCKGTNYNRDIYLVFFYLDGTNETSNGITTTAAYKIYYFNTTTSDKYLSYFQTWSKSDPNNNVAVISCINRSVIAVNKPYYYYYWEALNRLFPGQYYISVVAKDSTNATASSTSPTFYIVQNISDYYKLRPNMTGFDTPAPYHTFTARDIGSNYVWHLFDGQYLSDAWQPQVSNPPTSSVPDWAVFDLGTGNFNKLSRYTFYIMNDTNHRPMDWTVWGSNDNFTTSTLLDTRSSYTFNDLLGNFNIPTTDSTYRYYKWNFTSASGGVALVLDQIDMYFNESYSITNVNCTSCNIPYGSTTPPYTTDDTTPTFTFNTTNVQLACRISDRNWNYTTMGSSRDCDYGQYRTTHTCTLTTQDGLVNYNTSVYIICFGGVDSNNASIQLPMLITSLETPSSLEAIEQGIENSVIWPGATVYTNQKVYLRSINNSQKMTTVNKVAVYGNQRWLFNYVNENGTTLGLFNITPIVYVLDMKNMSTYAIRANVTAFIASTKN